MTREIGLVSCVKTKRDEPATPKNLYTPDYFEKMRSYAEQHHDDWWILSAKHGLLDPDGEPIEPYNETLTGLSVAKKREWSEKVAEQLDNERLLTEETTLVLHAGKDYYGELLPLIEDSGVTIEIPTEGLYIGEKKAWYTERV
ncbi:hypothetical protein GCM10008995_01550 [Halobellus salinus]|uniref:DUF6884 domain-containing protein n=1 Tax=Halobellus salinus TaxID=931585 RepID=A0A830EIP2_9EURY|nr:DUF6884 domain-containing protein [Halobellus salinus]GGI95087.1 hypothetical protein GCM10008995_01550 [Halobellus salinus]SMP20485.1 hypothetical protein SAMN06265347_107161 [Halobellus salinus]